MSQCIKWFWLIYITIKEGQKTYLNDAYQILG